MDPSPYALAASLATHDFSRRRVLVVGSGPMGYQHIKALHTMGVGKTTVVTTIRKTGDAVADEFGVEVRIGRIESELREGDDFDLVVVATPIDTLLEVTRHLLSRGYRNILVEKPASLWSTELERFERETIPTVARLRIAYNRNLYPSLLLLEKLAAEEGGITWCRYTFTEWASRIDFEKNTLPVYARWGISNSLHPIGMAHRLIGMPDRLAVHRSGRLEWHPSGSRFSGSGRSKAGVPFVFEADWESTGRWTVQAHTRKNAYRLIPLETLSVAQLGSDEWKPVDLLTSYSAVKPGVAEELAVMMEPSLERLLPLPTLADGIALIRLAEQIFGYSPDPESNAN